MLNNVFLGHICNRERENAVPYAVPKPQKVEKGTERDERFLKCCCIREQYRRTYMYQTRSLKLSMHQKTNKQSEYDRVDNISLVKHQRTNRTIEPRLIIFSLIFSNTNGILLHHLDRLYFNWYNFLMMFIRFQRQSDTISTSFSEETLLKTLLIVSVALRNNRDEIARCF